MYIKTDLLGVCALSFILILVFSIYIFIQLTPLLGFYSGRLHQVPKQPKLSIAIYILQFFSSLFFPNYLSQPTLSSLSLWEETGEPGENPRLLEECLNSSHVRSCRFDTGLEPVTSVVGGRRLDDWATEAPYFHMQLNQLKLSLTKPEMLKPSAKSTMEKTNLNSKAHSYYRPLNFMIFCWYSSNNW